MDPIETQIVHYTEVRARSRKLGFIYGYIAIGVWVLNATLGAWITNMQMASGNYSMLTVVSSAGVLVPIFGIMGIVQRNKAVKAREMIRSIELVRAQVAAQAAAPAAAPKASEPVASAEAAPTASAASSRAAKARKTKS